MTEKEKAKAGLLYDANNDPELIEERRVCIKKCCEYNLIPPDDLKLRAKAIADIVGVIGDNYYIEQPFHCDYGYNTFIGNNFYSNYNLVIIDAAAVTIGDHVLLGPDCGLYTANHPTNVNQRNAGYEYAFPITIGNNVWFGGGVRVMPGVTIGNSTIIGGGSVITKDIPSGVVAAGNPCRVIKVLSEEDVMEVASAEHIGMAWMKN